MANVPQALVTAVGPSVDPAVGDWWIRDLTDSYSWLKGGNIIWVIGSEAGSAVAYGDSSGRYIRLSGPDGLPYISRLIASRIGDDPWQSLGVDGFARLLTELARDPRLRVADSEFLRKQRPFLKTWLLGTETDPEALASLCVRPELRQRPGGVWELRFNVIDYDGGAEQWLVTGNRGPFGITQINVKELSPKGTFSYPEEL